MKQFTNALRLLLKVLYRCLCVVLIVLVTVMTVVMFLQIVMRAMGMQSFKWSEEVLRYLYIWTIFLGVPVAIYTNDLTRFDLLQQRLSPMVNKLLETAIVIVMLVILYFMCRGSLTMVQVQMRQQMTSLRVPMGVVYLSMPICAVTSMAFYVAKLFLMWTGQPDLAEQATPAGEGEEAQ